LRVKTWGKPRPKIRRERLEQDLQILLVRSRLEPLVKRGILLDYWSTPNELVGMIYRERPWLARDASKMGVQKGVPDLTLRAIVDGVGRICWMELKSDTGSLTEAQKGFKARSEAGGWPWYEIRSVEGFDAALKDWLCQGRF